MRMRYLEIKEFLKKNNITDIKMDEIVRKVNIKSKVVEKLTKEKHWSDLTLTILEKILEIYDKIVPETCGECKYFKDAESEYLKKYGVTFCKLSDEQTYSFVNPIDRCVPRPTQCTYNPYKQNKIKK